jgi:hypothetical protein
MRIAEGLARQIRRVAGIRGAYVARCGGVPDCPADVDVIDAALERACTAIGTGDQVTITAAGQVLEAIEE